MKINEEYFRALLRQTIEEDPLCCRSIFLLCGLEFCKDVPSLCVTLGARSVLRVNLDFVSRHCRTEQHVQALLIHEFLHILLGHTLRFKTMTPALNVALDAVINAIIHRRLGKSFSSMMSEYYADAEGPLRLLRPMTCQEMDRWKSLRILEVPSTPVLRELSHLQIHAGLAKGQMVSDDILDFVQQLAVENLERLLQEGRPVLLGGHGQPSEPLEALPHALQERVRHAWSALKPDGIWRKGNPIRQELTPPPNKQRIPPEWAGSTRIILQRLLLPDKRATLAVETKTLCKLPVLTPADRRGVLRTLWNPILPSFDWTAGAKPPRGTVQIYLDVSGSMGLDLPWLVALLAEFSPWIRHPLWAFSSEVAPAKIKQGKLLTTTTGATEMSCVLAHARRSAARKVLVITDGFVETPPSHHQLPCTMEALIPHDGCSEILQSYGIPVSVLPSRPR